MYRGTADLHDRIMGYSWGSGSVKLQMNGECKQHGTKPAVLCDKTMDGTNRLFVAVLFGITCDHEH